MESAWKKMISDYILVQAEISLAIGIIGSIFDGDEKITYHYFFIPVLMGIVCMLPCVITYFKEDMTIKQILFQRVVEVIVLEIAFNGVVYYLIGDDLKRSGYIAMAISVFIFDILTYSISYFLEQRDVNAVNRKLEEERKKQEG